MTSLSPRSSAPPSSPSAMAAASRPLDNPAPTLLAPRPRPLSSAVAGHASEGWNAEEVFELLRTIVDPEHPHTLEELGVVKEEDVEVRDETTKGKVEVRFTPTVPHCSMATLIGLCIRIRLMRELPEYFKVDVAVAPGTHANEEAVNKQLGDKERVEAAMQNPGMMELVEQCLVEPSY